MDLSFLPNQPEEKMDLGFLPDQPTRTFPHERSPREGLYEQEVPKLPLPALKKQFPFISFPMTEVGLGTVIPGYDVIKETIQGTREVSPDVVMRPLAETAEMLLFGKLLGGAFKAIKGSTWFRMLGNKERGLITQSAEDMIKVRETQIRTAQREISGRLGKPPVEGDYNTTKDFAIAQKRYHDKSADLLKDYDIISEGDIARRVEGYGKKLSEERMQYEKPTIPVEEPVKPAPVAPAPKPEEIDLTNLPDQPALSPTAKDQFTLPGIKQGLEIRGAKEVTPTLEGTPLMEAARKEEIERIQPKLFGVKKPVKKPEEKGDILFWIRSKGGIDPDTVSADVKELTQKESGFKGKSSLVRKGGRGLDELAQEWGWERGGEISTDELADAIKDAVQAKRKGVPRKPGIGSTEQEIDQYIRRQEEDLYRTQIYEEDPGLTKEETFKKLTDSFDDEIMGFKEELRDEGYSEADITRAIGKAQKDIEIEKRPPNLESIKKELVPEPKETVTKLDLSKLPDQPGKPIGKTISQFTKEYKEGLGEGGFIKVGGVDKPTPKVVVPGTKDISLLEFPLTTLHVADRHPFLKPIIEANIKAEQNTNDWILRHEDKIAEVFDRVEKPNLWMKIFGRKGTAIRDVDLMIEGKIPVPKELTGFVSEMKDVLGGIKSEVIQKMKNDFTDSLSPIQQEYLGWELGGRIGDEPKITVAKHSYTNKKGKLVTVEEYQRPVPKSTKQAVEEAKNQFKEMEGWGIHDYFPHIFKGRYKYLTEDGYIIASGQTAKQAKANFEEYVESHPETVDQTFMFTNDFYDLMTVRKILNPELTNPLEYLGTKLSRKEFFRLLSKTENVIKEEIVKAGVADVPKVNVDMSGIASFQKGTKFSGHFLQRKTSLRGEETDPFRALMSYVFSVGRKLGLEDAKKASYAFSDKLPANMPNAKSYIKMQADNVSGRYNIIDKLFDETIGEKLGAKPFGVTRIFAKGVGLESKFKLGYAPIKTVVNRMGGIFHTVLQEGVGNYIAGRKLIHAKDPDLMGRIEREGHLAGMEQLFAGEGLIGISKKQTSLWRPLGTYQKAEVSNRSEALASAYAAGLKKFSGDKDAAWIYAIDSARLTQGLYNIGAKPVLVRGPVAGASYQFKQYLNNEIRFMSQLTPAQWGGYIAGIVASAGTRGALLTIKSIIGIAIIGLGIDELAERLNRKAPRLHRGIFGLVGFDISAPASWQIPSSVKDWLGVFPRDLLETGEMIIKGLKNKGWTDEQINDYVRQITPVGYNVFKGIQMLSEGVTKEGTKVIYRGGKEEGIINLAGARSVSQSQASDSARYMNQQRQSFLEKSKVLEDRLFGSKSSKEASNTFKELVELKNIQTPKELEDLINGLRSSAKSRILTEEARIFMTLPKSLKKEEIKRR